MPTVIQRIVSILLSLVSYSVAMVLWPDLRNTSERPVEPKPVEWSQKSLGQWCRNFTINRHQQCPQASAFHQFDCCGETGTECCFAIQGWVYILGGMLGSIVLITTAFVIFLKLNLLCIEKAYPPKVIRLEDD